MANMWTDLTRWEADNNAVVFMVVSTEDIRYSLEAYNAFDSECDDYICEVGDVSETIIFDAIADAYDKLDSHYGLDYECINDYCYDYIVQILNERIADSVQAKQHGWGRGNLWNSKTKQFDKVQDFMKQRQTELF